MKAASDLNEPQSDILQSHPNGSYASEYYTSPI